MWCCGCGPLNWPHLCSAKISCILKTYVCIRPICRNNIYPYVLVLGTKYGSLFRGYLLEAVIWENCPALSLADTVNIRPFSVPLELSVSCPTKRRSEHGLSIVGGWWPAMFTFGHRQTLSTIWCKIAVDLDWFWLDLDWFWLNLTWFWLDLDRFWLDLDWFLIDLDGFLHDRFLVDCYWIVATENAGCLCSVLNGAQSVADGLNDLEPVLTLPA